MNTRKCRNCASPAAFLSALCEKCQEKARLAKKRNHRKKVLDRLASEPRYKTYRVNRLKRMEKWMEDEA